VKPEERPAPDWLGDVGAGVDAWTHGAVPPPSDEPSLDRPRPGGRRARSGQRSRRTTKAPPTDRVAQGPEADPESVARTILLDQLTGRARSRRELADKLASREVPDEIATRLLDRFTEVGLIDDAAFARTWVEQRQSGKGLAKRALQQELRRKGVDDETVREALDEVDPDAEEEAARTLVRRKLRSLARFDDTVATRRLVGMLARKGYGSGIAYRVVREELADSGRSGVDGSDESLDVD
jgi:regulatory protein